MPLSGGPLCRGVCGHRKMHQTSTVMAENHEREQQLERDGGHDEEMPGVSRFVQRSSL
jgi:hypothetical protein